MRYRSRYSKLAFHHNRSISWSVKVLKLLGNTPYPIVHKIDDKADAVSFGRLNDVVKALETVCASIDDW